MCGRFVSPEDAEIERAWNARRTSGLPMACNYNTSPSADIPILCKRDRSIAIATAAWGLVPPWWKTAAPPTASFNARLEEAADKPMWRHPMRFSRCLVPAEGWFEWKALTRPDPKTGKAKPYKQPYFFHRPGNALLCFAGLMSTRTTPEQDTPLVTCAILTTAATGTLAGIHERMPVVLDDAAFAEWLDPGRTQVGEAEATIRRFIRTAYCVRHPVGVAVNDARAQGPQLLEKARIE
jgi:putative SOS response-associated peptidase YedK